MEPAPEPLRIRADLTFNIYPAVCDGITAAVTYGWRRAYKYMPNEPCEDTRNAVCEAIEESVRNWFCETFSWPGPETE